MRNWSDVPPDEQLRLRELYGRKVDQSPQMRVCDLAEKNRLFTEFLAEHGVLWAPQGSE